MSKSLFPRSNTFELTTLLPLFRQLVSNSDGFTRISCRAVLSLVVYFIPDFRTRSWPPCVPCVKAAIRGERWTCHGAAAVDNEDGNCNSIHVLQCRLILQKEYIDKSLVIKKRSFKNTLRESMRSLQKKEDNTCCLARGLTHKDY